jgi:hypothetical protein
MGLHKDNPSLSFFEREMRIRLWWQIRGLDARARQSLGGRVDGNDGDIRLPLNANDSELHPDMIDSPVEHTGSTEMLYCLMKYEAAEWRRTSKKAGIFNQLNQTSSSVESLALKNQAIDELEAIYERKYIRHCDLSIPLHHLSVTVTRLAICRMRFMAHHPRNLIGNITISPDDSDRLFDNAVRLLELDSDSRKSNYSAPLFAHMTTRSQLDAFIYILSELRRRSLGDKVTSAWNLVTMLYSHHPELITNSNGSQTNANTSFYTAFGDLTLEAWQARKQELIRSHGTRVDDITPQFIRDLQATRQQPAGNENMGIMAASMSINDGSGLQLTLGLGQDLNWEYWDQFLSTA